MHIIIIGRVMGMFVIELCPPFFDFSPKYSFYTKILLDVKHRNCLVNNFANESSGGVRMAASML